MLIPVAAKAYIAGIIDGEGCISLTKNHNSTKMAVSVNMVDKKAINFIRKYYGGKIYFCNRENEGNRRNSWRWERCHNSAALFIKDILPYLTVKKKHANALLKCDWSIKLTRWDGYAAERKRRALAKIKINSFNRRGKIGNKSK